MACDPITPQQQAQWIKEQIRRRQYWLVERVRGGHSDESCAQYERDVQVLLTIQRHLTQTTAQQELTQQSPARDALGRVVYDTYIAAFLPRPWGRPWCPTFDELPATQQAAFEAAGHAAVATAAAQQGEEAP